MTWVVGLRPLRQVVAAALAGLVLLAVLWGLVPSHVVPLLLVQLSAISLAVGPAYLVDEDSLEIAQVTPRARTLRLWVTVPAGLATCALGWSAMAVMVSWVSPDAPLGTLSWQVAGLAAAAWAGSTLMSRRGVARPGSAVAAVVVLAACTELLVAPFQALADAVTPGASTDWWPVLVLSAAAVGVLSCRDVAAPRLTPASRSAPAPGRSHEKEQ